MEYLSPPEAELGRWFKAQSLVALRDSLAVRTYSGYPARCDRLWVDNPLRYEIEPLVIPDGPWETSEGAVPSIRERSRFGPDQRQDAWGRPLHPWFDEMLTDADIGIVTGKGAYWRWGPNYTADAIVIRHDTETPQVLLIKRADTGQLALPGGYLSDNETSLDAALRETAEETGLDLARLQPTTQQVYEGPLADLRITANAWPETTAFRFDVPTIPTLDQIKGGDDATTALWLPLAQARDLFGSHSLLIQLALRQ